MLDKKEDLINQQITHQFVEAPKKYYNFLHTIKEWNKENKFMYYRLRNDYMEKRKLHAMDLGLDKVMEESMWPI